MDTSRKKFVSSILTKTDPQTQLLALIKKLDITYSYKSRSKYVKEYCDFIRCFVIDEHRQLRNCWNTVRDMLLNKENPELQKVGFDIMCAIVQAHRKRLGSLQYDCFCCICQLPQGSVYGPILLTHLTKGGLDLLFKDEITELLLSWIKHTRQSISVVLSRETRAKSNPLNNYTDLWKNYKEYFLVSSTISENIIAYHFPSMNEAHRTKIILEYCHLLISLVSREEYAIRIIHVLRTISTHCSHIPSNCFNPILSTLAKTSEFQRLIEESKLILQNFQGLYRIHTIGVLISILEQSSPHQTNNHLIRGAVFLISDILWNIDSTEMVPSYFFNIILTTIESVLYCANAPLAYKVLSSIQKLVKSYGRELKLEWETICNILSKLHEITTQRNSVNLFAPILQDLLLAMNENRHDNIFLANERFFWDVIEKYSSFMPEFMLVQALEYRSREIHPLNSYWIDTLEHMVKNYIADAPSEDSIQSYPLSVKLNVLKFLKNTFDSYKYFYGDLIVQKTLVSLKRAYPCSDAVLNKTCIELVVHFANGVYTESIFFKVIDYLTNFIEKDCHMDCKYFATQQLLDLFCNKFSTKFTNHVLYLYHLLISLLSHHDVKIRSDVQALLSSLRVTADGSFSLDSTSSPYLKLTPRSTQPCPSSQDRETANSSAPNTDFASPYLDISVLFYTLQNRLCKEPCPELFESICKTLMNFLQNYWMMTTISVVPLVSLLLKLLRNQLFGVSAQNLLYPEGTIGHLKTGYGLLLSTIPYIFYEKHPDESVLSLRKSVIETFVFAISNQHLLPPDNVDHGLLQVCFSALIQCNHIAPVLITDHIPVITKIIYSLSSIKTTASSSVNPSGSENSALLTLLPLDVRFYILEYLHAVIRESTLIDISIKNGKLILLTLLNFTHPDRVSPPLVVLAFQILANWFIHVDVSNRSSVFDLILHSVKQNVTHQRSYISEAYIDLFSRLTFTNFEPIDIVNYLPKNNYNMTMLFNEKLGSTTQSWYQQNAIFTIKTNSTGWAHVTVRRASGTTSWLMQFQKKLRNVQNGTKGDVGTHNSSNSDIMPDIICPQYLALSDYIDCLKNLVELSQKIFEPEPVRDLCFSACNSHSPKSCNKFDSNSRNSKKSRLGSKQKLKKTSSKNLKYKSIHRKTPTSVSDNTRDVCGTGSESVSSAQSQLSSPNNALTTKFSIEKFRQKDSDCVDDDKQKQDGNLNLRVSSNKSSIEARSFRQMGYESTSARDVQMPFHQFINQQDPRLFGSSFRKSKTLSFSVCVNSCKYTQKAPHDDFSLVSEQNNGLFSRHIPLSYTIEFPTAGSLFTLVNTNTDFQKVTRLTPESEYLYQSGSFAQLPLFSEDTPVQQLDFSGDICSEDQRLNSKAKWANKALAEIPKAFDFIYTKGEGGSPIAKANGRQDQSSDVRAHISHRDEFITNQSNRPAQNHHHRKPSTTTNKNFNSPNNSVKKNYKLDPHLNTEKICPDICPSFVFSQFQPFICKDGSGAKALEQSEALNRALAVLDLTIACETYKAGLMYVAPGQVHLEDILGNTHGSSFYNSFIQFLGEIVLLKDSCFFTGGLDKTKNLDGIYSLLWRDHVSQIMFHVTTFMPNLPSDPTFVNKTRHIGNDYIIIIWHDWDDAKCGNDTLAGHFNLVTIVIHSLNNGWYRISVQSKNQIYQPASFLSPQLVHGEDQLAHFVRILVINAHPLCKWNMMNQKKIDVVSHYEERLRQIDQIGQRLAVKNVDDLDQVFLH